MCTCSWVLNVPLQRKERKEMALTNCLVSGQPMSGPRGGSWVEVSRVGAGARSLACSSAAAGKRILLGKGQG